MRRRDFIKAVIVATAWPLAAGAQQRATPRRIAIWRIPFFFGLLIGPVGLYIRRYLQETDAFQEAHAGSKQQGLGAGLAQHLKETMVCVGIVTNGTIAFYVILLYMPTFARTQLNLPLDDAFLAQSIGPLCMIVMTPLFGSLSDRVGRRPIMMGALALYLCRYRG
jgi:nitrate/nitrite transporter NarK